MILTVQSGVDRLHFSRSGSQDWLCYNDCETLESSSTAEFSYLRRNQLNWTEAVRFIRVIPIEFEIYPKLRVEFTTSGLDTAQHDSWQHKLTTIYGSLIDSPPKRAHPVGLLNIGMSILSVEVLSLFMAWLHIPEGYRTSLGVVSRWLPNKNSFV